MILSYSYSPTFGWRTYENATLRKDTSGEYILLDEGGYEAPTRPFGGIHNLLEPRLLKSQFLVLDMAGLPPEVVKAIYAYRQQGKSGSIYEWNY